MRKIAFLDRDGVLNKEVNYLYKIDDYSLIENCLKALMNLKNLGFEFVIIKTRICGPRLTQERTRIYYDLV